MTRVEQLINAVAEARIRKPKKAKPTAAIAQETPFMTDQETEELVLGALGYGDELRLLSYVDRSLADVSGSVSRSSHHYSHSRTVSFELRVDYSYDDLRPNEQAEIDSLANKIEKKVSEEVVDCSDKIYRALEREWDYRLSDEAVDGDIEANWVENDHTWDEDGDEGGDLTWEQLDDRAKEKVRERWRQIIYEDPDTFWSEHIVEEWTAELEKMGFGDPKISWSGFSSQGNGASFTCSSFDLRAYTNFFLRGENKTRGHPYTDELFAAEYKREREAAMAAQQAAAVPVPPVGESEDEFAEYVQIAKQGAFDIGRVMPEIRSYMTGVKHYAWQAQTADWNHKVRAYATTSSSEEAGDHPWEFDMMVSRGASAARWRFHWWFKTPEQKADFGLNVKQFIADLGAYVGSSYDTPEVLVRRIAKMFNTQFGASGHFEETN